MQAEASPKRRTGLMIGAWVAVVLGALVLAAGATGIWANTWKRDDNGYFSANAHRYQTHTRAIATESITVGSYVPTWLAGKVRLDVSGNKRLFVGIAPKATVDAYLARVEHTEATKLDLDPFKVTYVDHPGTVDPGRPASEPFWAAAVSGTSRPLAWKLRSGKLVDRRDECRRLSPGRGDDRRRRQGSGTALGRNRAVPVRRRAACRWGADVRCPLTQLPSRRDGSSLGQLRRGVSA